MLHPYFISMKYGSLANQEGDVGEEVFTGKVHAQVLD